MNPIITTNNANNPNNSTGMAPGNQVTELFRPLAPLKPTTEGLPSFPVECLPPQLRAYVQAVAEHTQTPVDMAAGVALGVLATCLQGKVQVEGNIGHYEQTSLYVFLVANPGSRKSAVIHEMTTAIGDYEEQHNKELEPDIRKNKQEREALQRHIARLNKQLEQKYDQMVELELQHNQDLLADLPDIQPVQYFTDDCTSEMMTKLLKDNHGRMSLISAEGGAFDTITGRYSKKPNLDVWLKGICGDTIRVDRLNREPDYIRHPALSMIISAQPSVLNDVMQNGMLDGRGFLARILYVNIPTETELKPFRSAPIPDHVRERYHDLVYGLLARSDEECTILHLSKDAVKRIEAHYMEHQRYLLNHSRDMLEWGSKYLGLVLRIAGLLHVSAGLSGDEISGPLMTCAIMIGQYAFAHAEYAYSIMGADETVEKAQMVITRIRSEKKLTISRSDLYQKCRGRFFRDVKDIDPVLELLEDHGYIYTEVPPYLGVGRPPAAIVHVNPKVLEDE